MSDASIVLEGVVNIAKVEALHHEMEGLLERAMPTVINAAEVSRVDTAALQLFTSFINTMNSAGVSVSWEEVSEELIAAAMLAGLDKALNFN
jgi:ABC-type transporter Mla MlaB component